MHCVVDFARILSSSESQVPTKVRLRGRLVKRGGVSGKIDSEPLGSVCNKFVGKAWKLIWKELLHPLIKVHHQCGAVTGVVAVRRCVDLTAVAAEAWDVAARWECEEEWLHHR